MVWTGKDVESECAPNVATGYGDTRDCMQGGECYVSAGLHASCDYRSFTSTDMQYVTPFEFL